MHMCLGHSYTWTLHRNHWPIAVSVLAFVAELRALIMPALRDSALDCIALSDIERPLCGIAIHSPPWSSSVSSCMMWSGTRREVGRHHYQSQAQREVKLGLPVLL